MSFIVVSVIKRSDTDWISCGYEFLLFRIVDHACKFGIQKSEHLGSEPLIKRKQYLAITFALKAVAQGNEIFFDMLKSV